MSLYFSTCYLCCYALKHQGKFLMCENLLCNKPDSDSKNVSNQLLNHSASGLYLAELKIKGFSSGDLIPHVATEYVELECKISYMLQACSGRFEKWFALSRYVITEIKIL